MDTQKLTRLIQTVLRLNSDFSKDPLPTLSDLLLHTADDFYRDEAKLVEVLQIGIAANQLCSIHLVEADAQRRIPRIDGYVVADPALVSRLREHFFRQLEFAYERQFQIRKSAAVIIQDLFKDVKKYNNSHLGRMLNAAIILRQYEQLMIRQPGDYTEAAKRDRLHALLTHDDSDPLAPHEYVDADPPAAAAGAPDPRRAVDTGEGLEAERMDFSGGWGQAVEKFGVDFLLRIHFRKNEFNKIRFLVNTRKIAREKDLLFVQETALMLLGRIPNQADLRPHEGALRNLVASVQVRLQMIALERYEKQRKSPGA